ncbi:GTPase HflX [Bacteroidia bacterium]|nr:GTPase HflX [Bacteroidia bacterium]GHV42851.1 GTPase HflX [Bacteroidia bacterium]
MLETKKIIEKAVLVGIVTQNQSVEKEIEYLDELHFLAETAGVEVVKVFMQKLTMPDSRTFVGSGKLQEIAEYIAADEIDIAVFDDELSPSQLRNIENALNCKVLDRTTLILDIFASHARTAEAKVQVELAQYQYLLPRLTRMWTHLSRQRGGSVGMRGPGEKEIETDRRIINNRVALLKEKLKEIDQQKTTQRKHRDSLIRVSLVGYTNVGKSTLMNLISKSDVLTENKLFATLDTTVRKVVIDNLPFLLSDTVGFIRKLPHTLVESFKSTLDEVREADLLIHVVDISHPEFEDQFNTVNQILADINAGNKPIITLFNKIDAYKWVEKDEDDLTPATKENINLEEMQRMWLAKVNNPVFFISAVTKENLDNFRNFLYEEVKQLHIRSYPYDNFLY